MGQQGVRRRESFAERRAARAAVEDSNVVLEAALRFLESRQRSVVEVRRRLSTTGYRAELIEAAIERLLQLGVLDDEAFASSWVESRDRARPRGERALRQELRLKGVERTVLDRVMTAREGPSDVPTEPDLAAAERLIARHASALARVPDPRKRRQRAYALLARNGFDPEVASRVAAALVADDG
jgi:regulatory protein